MFIIIFLNYNQVKYNIDAKIFNNLILIKQFNKLCFFTKTSTNDI